MMLVDWHFGVRSLVLLEQAIRHRNIRVAVIENIARKTPALILTGESDAKANAIFIFLCHCNHTRYSTQAVLGIPAVRIGPVVDCDVVPCAGIPANFHLVDRFVVVATPTGDGHAKCWRAVAGISPVKLFCMRAEKVDNPSLDFNVEAAINERVKSTLNKCSCFDQRHYRIRNVDFVVAVDTNQCGYKVRSPANDECSNYCERHFQGFNFSARKSRFAAG